MIDLQLFSLKCGVETDDIFDILLTLFFELRHAQIFIRALLLKRVSLLAKFLDLYVERLNALLKRATRDLRIRLVTKGFFNLSTNLHVTRIELGESYQDGDFVVVFPGCPWGTPAACEAESKQYEQRWKANFGVAS